MFCLPPVAQGQDRVATVTGIAITGADLASGAAAVPREVRLLELIWPRIVGDYVAGHGLAASSAEIEEVAAYHREFERRDRAQRARKLEELGGRLAGTELAPEERARLEDFQATLRRLALADEEHARLPPLSPERLRAVLAPRVEMWKMNRAIYERYGGAVALTEMGPWPHEARAALIADYERLGLLEFTDAELRERFYATLRQSASMVVPPERIDFTPYWRLPIPPSYFPD
jgi:hypothetical protein